MTDQFDPARLRELHEAATPGPWGVWREPIGSVADAMDELALQAQATDPIIDAVVLIDAGGKCPAITGCGPTSDANAALIVALRNAVPAILAMADENAALKAEVARLREANGILEDGLQEVGDDYPGSSCQEWCQQQVRAARAALAGGSHD